MARSGRPTPAARVARLTKRGTALVVVGALAIVTAYLAGRSELLYVGVLSVLLPLLAVAFARFRRLGLEVTRSFVPEVVAIGQPAAVELAVVNSAPVPTPELAWQDFRPWAAGVNRTGLLPTLAARRGRAVTSRNVAHLRYELLPPRRGVFDIGPLSVSLADPFGLATGRTAVGGVDRLVVTPRLPALPDTGLAILASDGERMITRRAVGGEEDLSTREYRRGDAMRRVHWRATARHGELMVRQEEPRSHAEARIILDTRRSGYADQLSPHPRDEPASETFEQAISLAASIALHLSRSGFAVELVETGDRQLEPILPIRPFLRTLATIELSAASGDYPAGSNLQASSRPDSAHGTVFAIVSDADAATIDRLGTQRPAFDLAVAFVLARQNSCTLERLGKAGWTCVNVRPGDSVEGAWRTVAEVHGARYGR